MVVMITFYESFKHLYSQLCISRTHISRISPKSKVYTRHLSFIFYCFLPHISWIFSKSKLFLQSQDIWLRQSWLYIYRVDSRYNKLLRPSEITFLYRNIFISRLQKQNAKKFWTLGPGKKFSYIGIFVISVFFITRVHCTYICTYNYTNIPTYILITYHTCISESITRHSDITFILHPNSRFTWDFCRPSLTRINFTVIHSSHA